MKNKYKIEQISERKYGVIRYEYYKITNYDNDVDKLKKYVKELNEESMFNISWFIEDEEKGLLEKVIDTLD